MRRHLTPRAVGMLALAAGCATEPSTNAFDSVGDDAGTGAETDTGAEESASSSGEASDDGDADTDDGGMTKWDVGELPDLSIDLGCSKVDFLFVIDSSGSMAPHQQALIDSFDGFVQGISDQFGSAPDFHVGVISTDGYAFNAPQCQTLGALVDQVPSANYQGIVECGPYAEGGRFMTEEDDLGVAFPCTANLSPGGDTIERPVSAAIEAIGPTLGQPGGCNEGFSREDALLIIVIISNSMTGDETTADANPSQDPSGWHPAIAALKGGHPENAVAIGFISAGDTWCIPNGWDGYQAPNLISFVEDFGENGVVANVCEPDYGPIFQDAVSVVMEACEGFVEPG